MPAEVKQFVKGRDLSKIKIPEDPVEYGLRWIAWWHSLQPAWRLPKKPTEPLKDQNSMPNKPVWAKLSVAGQNGIVLAIVGLVIWSESVKYSVRNRTEGKTLQKYFVDVDLVLQMMAVNWRDDSEAIRKKISDR